MKTFPFTALHQNALTANEMKQLKGGGNCGYLPKSIIRPTPICGLTEEEAQSYAQMDPGSGWCCNDCSSRSDGLKAC